MCVLPAADSGPPSANAGVLAMSERIPPAPPLPATPPRSNWALRLAARLGPGFAVSGVIAMAATFLSEHYGGPAMLFALLLGMAFHFLSLEGRCAAGIQARTEEHLDQTPAPGHSNLSHSLPQKFFPRTAMARRLDACRGPPPP